MQCSMSVLSLITLRKWGELCSEERAFSYKSDFTLLLKNATQKFNFRLKNVYINPIFPLDTDFHRSKNKI